MSEKEETKKNEEAEKTGLQEGDEEEVSLVSDEGLLLPRDVLLSAGIHILVLE